MPCATTEATAFGAAGRVKGVCSRSQVYPAKLGAAGPEITSRASIASPVCGR
jgi:hypothetical protein